LHQAFHSTPAKSVLAEVQPAKGLATQRVFQVFRVTASAQIEPERFRIAVFELGSRDLHHVQLVGDLLQVIAREVGLGDIFRIEGRKNFQTHYVSPIVQRLAAQIARKM
jgi:hypothetical protein